LVVGFAAGFYLGAMSGRERYHQINRAIGRAKRSGVARQVGKTLDTASQRRGHGRASPPPDLSGARLAPAGPEP
jgi:hypothetical protein